jgi:uncharacterized protein YndB with AHSA1/START domain
MNTEQRGWTHTHRCALAGAPNRVFDALTDDRQLRQWFAEHVKVEPRSGGSFRFWGRHTYGTPREGDARQRFTRYEPGRALSFQWPFDGLDTEVSFSLQAGDPDGETEQTKLTLEHRFPEKPAGPYAEELVDDLWRLTLGNLDAHLRGGEGVVLPDFSDPSPEVRASIVIDAPVERVFAALMDPTALNKWIASAAEVEPRQGGRYSYGWTYKVGERDVSGGPTRIIDLVPNERLVTDWPDWRGDPSKPPTRVAWLLERVGSKTRVTIVHGEFPRVVDVSDYPFGWPAFLRQLKTVVET